MHKLNGQDKRHLDAAEGWLELGNWREANEELESVAAAMRANPEVLVARFRVYEAAARWGEAIEVAGALCRFKPNDAMHCVYLARALNGTGCTREAITFLTGAAAHVPATEELFYDLACYCCTVGEAETARKWLNRAFEVGGSRAIKLRALNDTRLEALWRIAQS